VWRFWEVAIAWSQICGALGGGGMGEDIENVPGSGCVRYKKMSDERVEEEEGISFEVFTFLYVYLPNVQTGSRMPTVLVFKEPSRLSKIALPTSAVCTLAATPSDRYNFRSLALRASEKGPGTGI
jgi:hypothetical protein